MRVTGLFFVFFFGFVDVIGIRPILFHSQWAAWHDAKLGVSLSISSHSQLEAALLNCSHTIYSWLPLSLLLPLIFLSAPSLPSWSALLTASVACRITSSPSREFFDETTSLHSKESPHRNCIGDRIKDGRGCQRNCKSVKSLPESPKCRATANTKEN